MGNGSEIGKVCIRTECVGLCRQSLRMSNNRTNKGLIIGDDTFTSSV